VLRDLSGLDVLECAGDVALDVSGLGSCDFRKLSITEDSSSSLSFFSLIQA